MFKSSQYLSIIALLMISGCGTKTKDSAKVEKVSASTLVSDPQLSSSVVNASHGDAISALVDQTSGSASLTLEGTSESSKDSDVDKTSMTKTCEVDGASAVVKVATTVNRAKTSSSKNGKVTIERTRTGSSALTRIWSRADGTAVACNSAGKGALVDFENPNGLKLDVAFERSREESKTITSPKATKSTAKSFKASGKRSTTWSSNDATDDSSTTYVRNKSVVISDVKHELSMTDKNGNTVSSSLTMKTAEDKPLVVKVERNKSDDDVMSKTIVSGELETSKDSDAVIATSYSNLKMSFASNECKLVSGSATIVIKDIDSVVLKTLTLGVNVDGEAELKDEDGVVVEDFVLDDCDSEDLKI